MSEGEDWLERAYRRDWCCLGYSVYVGGGSEVIHSTKTKTPKSCHMYNPWCEGTHVFQRKDVKGGNHVFKEKMSKEEFCKRKKLRKKLFSCRGPNWGLNPRPHTVFDDKPKACILPLNYPAK